MKITIGCDPEVFFVKGQSLVSAIGKVPGSKEEPYPMGGGYFVLPDNVTAEFNVPPATDPIEFISNVNKGLEHVASFAMLHGLKIAKSISCGRFPKSELRTKSSKEFGCSPDYNAWTGMVNEPPCADDKQLRSCGGHVHVGTEEEVDPINAVKAMDLWLGIPSLAIDNDQNRRKLYGKAGSFRFKSYGFEYRTLSNFWIFDNKLIDWVHRATINAVEYSKTHDLSKDTWIQDCINEATIPDIPIVREIMSYVPV